jgi:transposase
MTPESMTLRRQKTGKMMGTTACLHRDHAAWQTRRERRNILWSHAAPLDHRTSCIQARKAAAVLAQIDPEDRNLFCHGTFLSFRWPEQHTLPGKRGGPFHKLRQSGARRTHRHHGWRADRNLVPDEARVSQKGGHAYIWAPRGSRPLMVHDNRHDSAYIFGAICPQRGVGAAIITLGANTEMMNLHLAEISTQVAPGAHAVLICDGAGWHQKGKLLHIPENMTLLPLLTYSPELNPMENVWDYLRQNKLCATVWDKYDDIVEACKTAWNWFIADLTLPCGRVPHDYLKAPI